MKLKIVLLQQSNMNKLSPRNLKKNLLPLFLVLVFVLQPVLTFSVERGSPTGPLPDTTLTGNEPESQLLEVGDTLTDNINDTDTNFESASLGEDPFSSDGPDPFADGAGDDFVPGQPSGYPTVPSGYQDGNILNDTADGLDAPPLYDADGNILQGDGTVENIQDSGDSTASISSSADRELRTTINNINKRASSQARAYANGGGASSTAPGLGVSPGSAGACVAGKLLSTVLASTITAAINGIINTAETYAGTAIALLSVPVADWNVKIDTLRTKEQLQTQNAARVGTSAGVPGSVNSLVNVSWDAVGYCIVNSMIDYIARSTIAWAKSGFKGNPAFIENPGRFFKEIGDIEASSFLNTLAYGTLGQSICEPFRAQIVLTIARDYLDSNGSGYYGSAGYAGGGYGGIGNGRTYGGCTLDDAKKNLKGFLKGNFSQGGWGSWFQISQIDTNNPYSVYLNLSSQLGNKVAQKKTIADKELTWTKGFLSFRKCENKNMKQEDCPIVTPGNLIEDQLSKTLNLSKERLVLAEKFDQVLDVVVNQLINTALNKLLN